VETVRIRDKKTTIVDAEGQTKIDMKLISCTEQKHSAAVLAILNDAIVNTTAVYDYVPRESHNMSAWFETKRIGGLPVFGMEKAGGELLGFATYGLFRNWPAYKYSVEHSVYVHRNHRGKGIGRQLLEMLLVRASQQGLHTMLGGIDLQNAASIALHESLGFTPAGTVRQVGFKFGRWLDLAFYQKILDTPSHPIDG
jgi:L-amino acid N-acyltransferase